MSRPERGFSLALVGPDGAGKTTVAHELVRVLPLPAQYLYMGVNPESSNRQLPTTRLLHWLQRARGAPPDRHGPRDPDTIRARPRGLSGAAREAKSMLRLMNQLAEEWYRQLLAWRSMREGRIVIYDRHYFSDYHAYDVSGPAASPSRRLHGLVLRRLYPHPDLVVYLDAPPDVLLQRKGEGSLELLERRRQDYRRLASVVPRFAEVDASRSLGDVVREVATVIERFAAERAAQRRHG